MEPFLLIKALLFLLFVLFLAYALFLFYKKKFLKETHTNKMIEILSHRSIDQRLAITLIEIDGKKFVIAHNQTAISLVTIDE